MLDVLVFLKDPSNREVLELVGAAIVTVVGGLWAVVKFYSTNDEGPKPSNRAEGGSVAIGGDSINSPINIGTRSSRKR